jgi:hypothetical protein
MRDDVTAFARVHAAPSARGSRSGFCLGLAVQRSFVLAGLKQDAVAALLGKDPSQFSKELLGRPGARLDFDLLLAIDDHTFWRALLMQLGDHFGLQFDPSDMLNRAVAQTVVALGDLQHELGKRRMAKADLPSASKTGVA